MDHIAQPRLLTDSQAAGGDPARNKHRTACERQCRGRILGVSSTKISAAKFMISGPERDTHHLHRGHVRRGAKFGGVPREVRGEQEDRPTKKTRIRNIIELVALTIPVSGSAIPPPRSCAIPAPTIEKIAVHDAGEARADSVGKETAVGGQLSRGSGPAIAPRTNSVPSAMKAKRVGKTFTPANQYSNSP